LGDNVAVNRYLAMVIAAMVGLLAGLATLKLLGQPTPL
jgi:hypothetical protein